jgi:hypothetical protein
MEKAMQRIVLAATILLFAAGSATAQGATCASRAVGSDGKPLAGAAKTAFLTKCKREACEPKAVDKSGKVLAGAAKTSFMKKCEAETP